MRKIFFYTGLIVLILAAVTVGGYHYMLNRYAGEMDKLIDILLTEMQEGESQNEQGKENTSNTEEDKDNTGVTSSKTPGKNTGQNESSEAGASTSSTGTVSDHGASGPAKENTSNSEKLKELEEKYTPALKNIELKDQLFTVQMLKKFSATELQEMYRLYTAGGKSRSELLKKMQEKITPEEMQRIKEIFQKNKGLL